MIKVIAFGKIKEKYLVDAINDYFSRIQKYHKLEIIELKDNVDINREESELLKYLDDRAFNVAMDIDGKSISSMEFSNFIDKNLMTYANINFIIGSSNGLSDVVKKKCNYRISFGKITMPHGVFRLILLEQIYRGFKIMNNESYHK